MAHWLHHLLASQHQSRKTAGMILECDAFGNTGEVHTTLTASVGEHNSPRSTSRLRHQNFQVVCGAPPNDACIASEHAIAALHEYPIIASVSLSLSLTTSWRSMMVWRTLH